MGQHRERSSVLAEWLRDAHLECLASKLVAEHNRPDIRFSQMPKPQLLIRDVPSVLKGWVDEQSRRRGLSQNQLLLSVLEKAAEGKLTPGLFAQPPAPSMQPSTPVAPFSFIDLFAGIGGFRLGLQRAGGDCRFSCEWDVHSQKTYKAWFGHTPHGDIRAVEPASIPDHDVLAAGFPCQPFSIAGVSKKQSLGRPHGFECDTQGTLFYNIAKIIEVKRPPVVMLENVKNLLSHDKGKTWKVIYSTLDGLGYRVFHKVIDAAAYVPQHRERIFIVCFDKEVFGEAPPFEFPVPPSSSRRLRDILEPAPPEKYTLTDHLWRYLQDYARRHQEKGNGFGFGMADLDGVARTLSARYYKDGSEILIPQKGKNPRRLTPREAARLMGYPDELPIVVSDTQAYRQFGNSLVPLIAEALGKEVAKVLVWALRRKGNGCLLKDGVAA